MNTLLELTAQDRVLVFAPHPDDESIATGGLLQKARAAGAACHLVVVTDGDNNPWPQRWIEKRWHIGPAERARWGARRREEARAAMHILGIAEDGARFLGLPDLGITDLLMRADQALIESLCALIDEFSPTLLVMPALSDRHPDHSATHILARLALARCHVAPPRLLAFAVHGEPRKQSPEGVALDDTQRRIKEAAIFAHASQMQFSRRRFLGFATEYEAYQLVPLALSPDPQHPLQAVIVDENRLEVRVDLQRWMASLRREALFLALECGESGSLRWRVELNSQAGHAVVHDTVAGASIDNAAIRRSDTDVVVSIPWSNFRILHQGYVKLARREPGWRVFDRFGWQAIAS